MAESLFSGVGFTPSQNDYDWLGHGVYFWQSNPLRALQFAEEKKARDQASWTPTVLGAVVNPGVCLDLSTSAGVAELKRAHQSLVALYAKSDGEIPSNAGGTDRLMRRLDCVVIQNLHGIKKEYGEAPIDTVLGVFREGPPLYKNSGFYEKTHIQICVCNPACIVGVFRVTDNSLQVSGGAQRST